MLGGQAYVACSTYITVASSPDGMTVSHSHSELSETHLVVQAYARREGAPGGDHSPKVFGIAAYR
jgi:hypothetical protein